MVGVSLRRVRRFKREQRDLDRAGDDGLGPVGMRSASVGLFVLADEQVIHFARDVVQAERVGFGQDVDVSAVGGAGGVAEWHG